MIKTLLTKKNITNNLFLVQMAYFTILSMDKTTLQELLDDLTHLAFSDVWIDFIYNL